MREMVMANPTDKRFGELVIANGLAEKKQIELCLKLVEQSAKRGKKLSLAQVLVQKKVLSKKKAQELVGVMKTLKAKQSSRRKPDAAAYLLNP